MQEYQLIFVDFFQKVGYQRDHGSVNLGVLMDLTQSLCTLRILSIVDVEQFSVNQRETYKSLFEDPIINVTREYYENEAKVKVDSMSISEYMIYVYSLD